MWEWIKHLDRILRGEATKLDNLRQGTIEVPVWGLLVLIDILGLIYGVCMGCYALLRPGPIVYYEQAIAAGVKVPLLFLLTLLVTFPSLYVFNALVGSRLNVLSVLRLLVASLAVILAVLASLGPIVAFFSFTTKSYSFMVLLNVAVYTVAGLLGLAFLLRTLHRLTVVRALWPASSPPCPAAEASPADPSSPPPSPVSGAGESDLEGPPGAQVRLVFRIWVMVFALVGAQMAWVLRPFIGDPNKPFAWFREREDNFFVGVWSALVKLFGK